MRPDGGGYDATHLSAPNHHRRNCIATCLTSVRRRLPIERSPSNRESVLLSCLCAREGLGSWTTQQMSTTMYQHPGYAQPGYPQQQYPQGYLPPQAAPYYGQPQYNAYDPAAFHAFYREQLRQLVQNSRPVIQQLTQLAIENLGRMGRVVADSIAEYIRNVSIVSSFLRYPQVDTSTLVPPALRRSTIA
ncbi:hypothetical protein CALCODRAFT_3783 [Calocera cornea HHB12733]|uniref:CID domain-containing protein n=1 Tax=Calocera cornea HHB12733 TaxID=1353952 RepID=A0A165KA58_9BASI|nr:hypothetical protein CALCODRAFT_3783 [Calocera cornea HHB12733]